MPISQNYTSFLHSYCSPEEYLCHVFQIHFKNITAKFKVYRIFNINFVIPDIKAMNNC